MNPLLKGFCAAVWPERDRVAYRLRRLTRHLDHEARIARLENICSVFEHWRDLLAKGGKR
jgi:hypothetical protein